MSDKAYYRDTVPEDHDDTYELLRGPNGFECLLTEPEDRTWGRDGKPVIAELNRLHSLLVKACVEIADRIDMTSVAKIIEHVEQNYGIRLRWTGAMFTEDTTK